MKKIIVPTDLSIISISGIELAIVFAERYSADIELVHVIKKESNEAPGEEKNKLNVIRQNLENIIEKYLKLHKNLKFTYIIKDGKIHEEIVNQSNATNDSVIVTSTHGASGWEELFIGSNAYKIVSASEKPVFTIRGNKVPEKIRKIIMPIDITAETREKVPFTAKIAEECKAEIHIISVSTTNNQDIQNKLQEYTNQVSNYLNTLGIPNYQDHLTGENITDITLEYAKSVKADLISVMTEQEKSFSNILLGSYAHQMINKSEIPVLLFPTKQIGIITESFLTEGIKY